MAFAPMNIGAIPCVVARSGYTGEDGFEISVAADQAESLARMLLAEPGVAPAGLGARDSLRLEAGLCLYGADIDTTTTPVEAGLAWTISRRRRQEAGFPGAETILAQLAKGSAKTRVGIQALDKTPARAHTAITDADGRTVGEITSGGFGPSVGGPVAMGYVDTRCAASGTKLMAVVRGTPREARVVDLPFVPHRYCLR
jgi:aminomethyltransferase